MANGVGATGKMRLKCPSCGAQYEIPDTVIPQEGRDVQCSNCGHTWLQTPAIGIAPDTQTATPAPQPVQAPDVSPPAPAPAPERAARRDLDPAVADILRQEAAFETRARKAEANQLEIQPELGLTEPQEVASSRARERERQGERVASDTNDAADPEADLSPEIAAPTWPKSRRDRLPDVEEINQTLRAATERREVRSVQASLDGNSDSQGGFRRGFLYTLCLFAVATAVYVYAPQLGQTIPELRVPLDSYDQSVDAVRGWLDGQVAALIDWGVGIIGTTTADDAPG